MKCIEIGQCEYVCISRPETEEKGGFDEQPQLVSVHWFDPRPDPHGHTPRPRIMISADDIGITMPADTARKVAAYLIAAADQDERSRGGSA